MMDDEVPVHSGRIRNEPADGESMNTSDDGGRVSINISRDQRVEQGIATVTDQRLRATTSVVRDK